MISEEININKNPRVSKAEIKKKINKEINREINRNEKKPKHSAATQFRHTAACGTCFLNTQAVLCRWIFRETCLLKSFAIPQGVAPSLKLLHDLQSTWPGQEQLKKNAVLRVL